jgi:hypothetical protein
MTDVWTHTGYIVGCDARTPRDWKRMVLLRETKKWWVAEDGTKWTKRWGSRVGEQHSWPMYCLKLDSVLAVPARIDNSK